MRIEPVESPIWWLVWPERALMWSEVMWSEGNVQAYVCTCSLQSVLWLIINMRTVTLNDWLEA